MSIASSDFQGACPTRPENDHMRQINTVTTTGWLVIASAIFSCLKKLPGLNILTLFIFYLLSRTCDG